MKAPRRLRAMQARAETLHTLTLAWYSPNGKTAAGADGMVRRAAKAEGTTRGKMQAPSQLPGVDTPTRMVKIGDTELPVLSGALHIGIRDLLDGAGALRLKIGWECTVAAVGADDDPALLGRKYRVVDVPVKSFSTARRIDVVDVTHLAVA